MSKRDIQNRLAILFQQLELMNRYRREFVERLGRNGYQKKIDDILDEINKWRRKLKEMGE